jgi:hypothetical protein
MKKIRFEVRDWQWLVGVLILAAGLKIWVVAKDFLPFNADEGVVALMARHILQGERPVFFYGQAYMGSLDAFLVAGAFSLFGQSVWVIRLVQSLIYLGVVLTTAWLGKEAFGSLRVGAIAAALMAIPTVNVTLYTTVSLGGYGEALLLGNLTVLCALRIGRYARETGHLTPYWLWGLVGFFSGLGLWAFGFALVFSLPAGIYLLVVLYRASSVALDTQPNSSAAVVPLKSKLANLWKRIRWSAAFAGIYLVGGLLGSAPWWGYALQYGFGQLLSELGGGAIAGVEGLPWLLQTGQHLVNALLLGSSVTFGLRPPWDVIWLALPLLPFALMFWMVVVVYLFKCLATPGPYRAAQGVLVGLILTLLLGFVFTPFGADPSGRYFLPQAVPLALFAASLIYSLRESRGKWAYVLLAFVLAYNLWGTVQCARNNPPGITTQFYAPSRIDQRHTSELIDFLRQRGETRGYTNYWVSYPVAFLSQEDLIFVPRLPYHLDFRYTERDDRYPPYNDLVTQSDRVAYITTHYPELDQRLRQKFDELGVVYSEIWIGDYHVFFNLSQVVRPEEIGMGKNWP